MSFTKNSSSDLALFKEAKTLSIKNFRNLQNVNESLLDLDKTLTEYNKEEFHVEETENTLKSTNEKCVRIINILERKKMKCAFFGRTSNGKSSVINSMLGQKILPFGIGHTTSCFVQIQGTAEREGYIIKSKNKKTELNNFKMDDNSDSETLPINSVGDLSHALSADKLSTETLISLFWPYQNCDLLKAEVTLLDSPGIDIDPDLDFWINHNCLDADVFVLVANAESTLTQTEKSFFHKVKQKLSNPNIFILNNRWDACDEEDFATEAKKQHEKRCIDFLTKELAVCSDQEALERVFFVSAKEMLECRTNESATKTDNEKILARYHSFIDFERSLEKNLCASALKTKFSSHSLQGLEMVETMLTILNKLAITMIEKLKDVTEKKSHHCQICSKIRTHLSKTNEIVDKKISIILDNILKKIVESLQLEIKHMNYIVRNFSSPFEPEASHLLTYKTELNKYVECEINKRISTFCSLFVQQELAQFKKFLIGVYSDLVGVEIDRSLVDIVDRSNEHDLPIPCNSLFANFKEDLSFQWPFNPQTLLYNVLLISSEARNQVSTIRTDPVNLSFRERFYILSPMMSHFWDTFMTKEFIGFCCISALIRRVTGFKLIISSACAYGILYMYERFRWNHHTQEKNFKSQYVKYASGQLTNLIDVFARSYGYGIKQVLQMSQENMNRFVDNELSRYDMYIRNEESEINYLNGVVTKVDSLKSEAIQVKHSLQKFKENYL